RLRHMLVQGAGLAACTKRALPRGPGRARHAVCARKSARSTTSSPEPPRRRRMTLRSGSRPRGPPEVTMHRPRGVFAGLATLDVIHRVDASPGPDEKVTALSQFVAAGGPAANAAVTFAALGGHAVLLTALGRSPIAGTISAELTEHGVEVIDVAPDLDGGAPVSAVTVLAATGERSVVGGDAAGVRAPAPPPQLMHEVLAGADVVLLDGHHPELARAVLSAAREAGLPTVLDAGRWKPIMEELVGAVTDVVASADFRTPGAPTSRATAAELIARGTRDRKSPRLHSSHVSISYAVFIPHPPSHPTFLHDALPISRPGRAVRRAGGRTADGPGRRAVEADHGGAGGGGDRRGRLGGLPHARRADLSRDGSGADRSRNPGGRHDRGAGPGALVERAGARHHRRAAGQSCRHPRGRGRVPRGLCLRPGRRGGPRGTNPLRGRGRSHPLRDGGSAQLGQRDR